MTAMDVKRIDVQRLAAVLEDVEDIEYAMIFGSVRLRGRVLGILRQNLRRSPSSQAVCLIAAKI